jgi:hypothetical protein
MPHEAQRDMPDTDLQGIILRLNRALSVKQKLKLHRRSLKGRRTKTIFH